MTRHCKDQRWRQRFGGAASLSVAANCPSELGNLSLNDLGRTLCGLFLLRLCISSGLRRTRCPLCLIEEGQRVRFSSPSLETAKNFLVLIPSEAVLRV